MKKLALVLAVSLSASPAFAATKVSSLSFLNANGSTTTFTTLTHEFLGLIPTGHVTAVSGTPGGSLAAAFPFTESYTLDLPGFGTASAAKTFNFNTVLFGTFTATAENGGKGNTYSFNESLVNP